MKNRITRTLRMCAALTMALMLASGMVGCGKTDGLSAGNGEIQLDGAEEYDITDLETFKALAQGYGEVLDVTESLGYEAAAVSTDKVNIIYVRPDDVATAKSMATGDKGSDGVELKVLDSGANYEYYEETVTPVSSSDKTDSAASGTEDDSQSDTSQTDPSSEDDSSSHTSDVSLYGIYLRVDNMLILITGDPANKNSIKAQAEEFYTGLGYPSFM